MPIEASALILILFGDILQPLLKRTIRSNINPRIISTIRSSDII